MASSIAAARSLGKKGVPVHGVAFDKRHPLLHSKYCTEAHLVTSPRDQYDQFVHDLRTVTQRDEVQTILPMNGYGIYTVRNTEEIQDDVSLIIPSIESYEAAWDRYRTVMMAQSCNIPTPETDLLSDRSKAPDRAVIKSRYSIIESDNELSYPGVELIDGNNSVDQEAVIERMSHEPIIQEYVPSTGEYGFFAVYDQGSPVATFQHRRIRSTSYSGGASAHREAVRIPEIDRLGRRLLDKLDWHGPAMVEFRRDSRDGTFRLMEINPRFWGSLALGIAAGVDFPWLYYQLASGYSDDGVSDMGYNTHVQASYIRAELQHFGSVCFERGPSFVPRPGVVETVLSQLRSAPTSEHDLLDADDPLPFVYDVYKSVTALLDRL
ncbi:MULTISPECIES: ATP-grasp domain-containing protein [Halorubrum]|nr:MULTISPECIES: ATP-grasp domain-containing protein [Halorubrum]TKX72846.1 carboxylate--amine ligase [Halorubrum sp. GN11GM_10-3_MGM]